MTVVTGSAADLWSSVVVVVVVGGCSCFLSMAANRELNVSLHQRTFSPAKTHTQVFLALCCGSGPRQGSFTSKLFSTVYYTEVMLAPGARIPKRKLFLYI